MIDKLLNIRHLRVFCEVARTKSISKASENVFLSQPAMTQAIAKLEHLLETSLFQRKHEGMYLTDSGELLLVRVESAFKLLHEGLRDALKNIDNQRCNLLLNALTTTQLRALVAMASARSISEAGRNIGIAQSAIHRSIKELEALLKIQLLEKTSTGINPGKAALILSRASKLAFSEINQACEEIASLHSRETGHLQIGSMPLARTSVLPNTILHFSEQYPDFTISVVDGPYSDLLHHLRHANIDLLIGALRFPVPTDDVVQEAFFQSEVVIVARPDHPLMQRAVTMEDLIQASWVVPHQWTPTRAIFEQFFANANKLSPKRLVETSSQILIRSLLEGSDRLTVTSSHQFQRELDEGWLAILPFRIRDAYRPIGISMRKGWRPTATQQAFIEMLRQQAGSVTGYHPHSDGE